MQYQRRGSGLLGQSKSVIGTDGRVKAVDPSTGAVVDIGPMPGTRGPAALVPGQGIMLNNSTIPAPGNFDSYLEPNPDMVDVIWKKYWDSVALTSASAQQWNAFQQPANSNAFNSNLYGANGTLQGTEKFWITSVRFEVENDSTSSPLNVVVVKEILRQAYYQFIIQNKPYNDGKLMEFLLEDTNFVVNTNYFAIRPFKTWALAIPIAIGTRTGFYVQTTLTNPTLSGSNYRLFCYLTGALYRGVQ